MKSELFKTLNFTPTGNKASTGIDAIGLAAFIKEAIEKNTTLYNYQREGELNKVEGKSIGAQFVAYLEELGGKLFYQFFGEDEDYHYKTWTWDDALVQVSLNDDTN